MAAETADIDYTLANPDTLTKYKTAAQISHKVLETVAGWLADGEKVLDICQRGDALLDEEIGKVYKGKKILKGISHPCTVSPNSYITPYTPLASDPTDAETTLKKGEVAKIQLGAQIDGFGTIVCDNVIVPAKKGETAEVTGRDADLLLATYYANEVMLRMMMPPGLLASGTDEEKAKAAKARAPTQHEISQKLEKIAKSYGVSLVENTTSWLFERNEIEAKKKIVVSPSEGHKGEGTAELGEVWGVEVGMSLGSGKIKTLENRPTLHRRTAVTYALKRPSSRQILSEIVKKFGTFPFSLRQLEDERAGKVGIVECVRSGVVRQYEVIADKDNAAVSRLFTTIAITKNGLTKLSTAPVLDLEKVKSDKKITDEEILKLLETPLARSTGTKSKNKKKKKKPAKKAAAAAAAEEESSEEDSDDE